MGDDNDEWWTIFEEKTCNIIKKCNGKHNNDYDNDNDNDNEKTIETETNIETICHNNDVAATATVSLPVALCFYGLWPMVSPTMSSAFNLHSLFTKRYRAIVYGHAVIPVNNGNGNDNDNDNLTGFIKSPFNGKEWMSEYQIIC